jgi:hypothetical protein
MSKTTVRASAASRRTTSRRSGSCALSLTPPCCVQRWIGEKSRPSMYVARVPTSIEQWTAVLAAAVKTPLAQCKFEIVTVYGGVEIRVWSQAGRGAAASPTLTGANSCAEGHLYTAEELVVMLHGVPLPPAPVSLRDERTAVSAIGLGLGVGRLTNDESHRVREYVWTLIRRRPELETV